MSTANAVSVNLSWTVLKLLHMYSAAAVAFVAPPPRNELRLAAEQPADAMANVCCSGVVRIGN